MNKCILTVWFCMMVLACAGCDRNKAENQPKPKTSATTSAVKDVHSQTSAPSDNKSTTQSSIDGLKHLSSTIAAPQNSVFYFVPQTKTKKMTADSKAALSKRLLQGGVSLKEVPWPPKPMMIAPGYHIDIFESSDTEQPPGQVSMDIQILIFIDTDWSVLGISISDYRNDKRYIMSGGTDEFYAWLQEHILLDKKR